MTHPLVRGFQDELSKLARKAVHFREKDVPAKAKRMYSAMKAKPGEMKGRYGKRWKEVAARTALKASKK